MTEVKTAEKKDKNVAYYVNKLSQLQKDSESGPDAIKRYALFPILDEKGYEFYQKQENIHWFASELDFVADRKHYDEATPQVKKVVDTILAFFLEADGLISENVVFRFLMECKTYEEKAMFISQLHIELVHAETYSLAAFTFKRDPKAMAELIESAQNTDCVKRKIEFMEKWMLADRPRYQRLVAFACAEGIFFCTLFAVIFWFRSKGLFQNFILANELIARDESLHRDWGSYLFGQEISEMLSPYEKSSKEYQALYKEIEENVKKIVFEAIEIEDIFSDHILSEKLEDMSAQDLKVYTRLISDNLFVQLGYPTHFNVKNPFTWLDDISMEQKGNFFEVGIGSYVKTSLSEILNWKKRAGLEEKGVDSFKNPEDIDF